MDAYTPALLEKGLKGMIGKGARNQAVKEGIQKYKAVYFAAIGGSGALISKSIQSAEVIAYPDLGTEAIRKLTVEAFPLIVANDVHGGDLYESGMKEYRR
jgi:fumarate hydratase subunit beta